MDLVTLKTSKGEVEFSQEHAQNILDHNINSTIKDPWKLPKGSDWEFKKGELKKKK